MAEEKDNLAQFRKEIYSNLIERGVNPPEEGSAQENELYNRWLRGKSKLANPQNKNGK